ncbi:MAG TPA: SDR family oxidoreductase [Pseudonocardia sp.]|jgi:uncharacterized protein YbjT (DUF2867 family)
MEIAIIGAHGQIARLLTRLLVARGDGVRGLVRNAGHIEDLRSDGSEPVVCDVESAGADELADAVRGVDAVVFAAGAGPGSGAGRKWTVDRDGATKLIEAARAAAVPRYVMVSAVGAENPPSDDSVFSVYLRAKAEADTALMASDLSWTIVRPGPLEDEPGTGRVTLTREAIRGKVPREDVAAVLAALLHDPGASGRLLYLASGDDPIDAALG